MKPANHSIGETTGRMVDNHGHLEWVPDQPVIPASCYPAPKRAPAPRRRDGWTVERQRIFIDTLAATGCVALAAAEANITPRSAYRLRNHPKGAAFAAAWRAALMTAADRLTNIAFERATIGTPREVWRGGKLIGESSIPSDRLLMFLLNHLVPDLFGRDGDPKTRAAAIVAAQGKLPGAMAALADIDEQADLLNAEDYGPQPPRELEA